MGIGISGGKMAGSVRSEIVEGENARIEHVWQGMRRDEDKVREIFLSITDEEVELLMGRLTPQGRLWLEEVVPGLRARYGKLYLEQQIGWVRTYLAKQARLSQIQNERERRYLGEVKR